MIILVRVVRYNHDHVFATYKLQLQSGDYMTDSIRIIQLFEYFEVLGLSNRSRCAVLCGNFAYVTSYHTCHPFHSQVAISIPIEF